MFPSAHVSGLGKNLLYAPSKGLEAAELGPATKLLAHRNLQGLRTALSTFRVGAPKACLNLWRGTPLFTELLVGFSQTGLPRYGLLRNCRFWRFLEAGPRGL